ncbi:MAG TPA: YidC/Oxa1 family membrane protein insertase [Solirubrobacterales bacterium]|nr:YidC/Oxa1 family membrane protein insertase [Solirubrobacterales bacterium]
MSLPFGFQLAPQFLVDIADEVLVFFHDSGLSWGMSIVALTVCMRTLLIPLTYKQLKGMRAMQALQPQIKELQEKYKNDKQRMQQEMMRFYKENKVNPFASCIPLLAQLPVFITLFYVLQHDLRFDICGQTAETCGEFAVTQGHSAGFFGESFFFINDLTSKATGSELIVLLVIYVGTQLISGMVMAVTADKSQRMLMFLLPLFFVPFILNFPAGLILYWITTNFWTIGQSFVVKKLIPVPVAATPAGATAIKEAKPPPKPPKKKKRKRR